MGPCPRAASPLPTLAFTTAALPPRDRFDAYLADATGAFRIEPPDGAAPVDFQAARTVWHLGAFLLSVARTDALRSARDARMIQRDGLDHWTVTAWRGGEMRWRAGEATAAAARGRVYVHGMHQAAEGLTGATEWLRLFIPRDALPGLRDVPPTDDVGGPMGELLWTHLDTLARVAGRLSAVEAPGVAEATLALVRAALSGRRDDAEAARPPLREALRLRALALVRENLGSVRLDPARLARLAGVSRTRLYEAFEAEGGVARAIQRERLLAVRRALADPRETRPAARIAEACGLPDPSAFGRGFRRTFGITPHAFREQVRAGTARPPAALARGDSFASLLRGLRAGVVA